MGLRWGGSAAGAGPGGTGAGLSVLYAGTMVETTISGAHAAGSTTIVLADASGFRTDMRFGSQLPVMNAGSVEYHDIVSVDEAAGEIEIAAPGLIGAHAGGTACFAAPMWGADDTLVLPAPAGAAHYSELDCWLLYDLPQLNGNNAFYSGRSLGDYVAPNASSYHSLTTYSYWYADGNTEEGLASYSVGVVHATASLSNLWTVDYELATNRLVLVPGAAALVVGFAPRVYQMTLVGRA